MQKYGYSILEISVVGPEVDTFSLMDDQAIYLYFNVQVEMFQIFTTCLVVVSKVHEVCHKIHLSQNVAKKFVCFWKYFEKKICPVGRYEYKINWLKYSVPCFIR